MYVAFLGGQSGRFRERSSSRTVELGIADQASLKHVLVDLAHEQEQTSSLRRLLANLHAEVNGKILALVLLAVESCYHGVMTPLDFEQRVGMAISRCQGRACFVRVIAVADLDESTVATYRGATFPKYMAFELTDESVDAALRAFTRSGQTVQSVLAEWRQRHGNRILNLSPANRYRPCSFLQVACFMAKLTALRLWTSITVAENHLRFDRSCDLYPLKMDIMLRLRETPLAPNLQAAAAESIAEHGLVRASMFSTIAERLVRWGPGIIGEAQDADEADARRLQLEAMVAWLKAADRSTDDNALLESRLATRQFGEWDEELGHFVAYKIGFLVECLVLSFNLRSSSGLGATMQQAVRLLPPAWSASLSALVRCDGSSRSRLPSASTLSRARLYMDVGFMLFLQQRHADLLAAENPPVFYGLCDSSPQGGRNWEIFEMFYINGEDLDTCADAAKRMLNFSVDEDTDPADLEDFDFWRARVSQLISHHVFAPTALGARRASLAQKLHACVHAMRLENVGWHQTARFSDRFIALTTDMGSEMDLNRVDHIDVATFFPYWLKMGIRPESDDAADGDGHADESGVKVTLSGSLYIPGATSVHIYREASQHKKSY